MGRVAAVVNSKRQDRRNCQDSTAPICATDCCWNDLPLSPKFFPSPPPKDLLVIGAGPHALSLVLRLLEPDADFQTDKERHLQAEHTKKQRPIRQVFQHVQRLSRPTTMKKYTAQRQAQQVKKYDNTGPAPALSLEQVLSSVVVIDPAGDWMEGWNRNFDALQIQHLRSPINAHADPFDHRALQFYAEAKREEKEMISLPFLKRTADYRGPFQAPSTALFREYNERLIAGYGIGDMVQPGTVESVVPNQQEFEVTVRSNNGTTSIIRAKRVVCAMGPQFRTGQAFWETSLRQRYTSSIPQDGILHAHEILPWLKKSESSPPTQRLRLLIIGGGITSAQMALLASTSSSWCSSVTLLQRSMILARQFDVLSKWMGPCRGKLLEDFWSLPYHQRAKQLKDERKGGSIPPELVNALRIRQECQQSVPLKVMEEVQVSDVEHDPNASEFHVSLDNGVADTFDMIWLATGGDNDIALYPVLSRLLEVLPVPVVSGLPVLGSDLSWKSQTNENEPMWKGEMRRRLYVMGVLAGLELGPDALNLIGARHGAVRVAQAIRKDMHKSRMQRANIDKSSIVPVNDKT